MFTRIKRNVGTCAIALALIAPAGFAQTKAGSPSGSSANAQAFVLKKVTSSGSKRFAEPDIVKATGLKLDSSVTAGDLEEAAKRLGLSGAFAQVAYRYSGDAADFTVVDAAQFVPATFENFVWFSDVELIRRVHDSVPLFNGSVPLAGNMADDVSAALDSVLREKGIQGHTTATMRAKLWGPLDGMQFRIEGVNVKIAEIRFLGAAPERLPFLLEATKKTAAEDYLQSSFATAIKSDVPPVYGKLGFLRARFGKPKPVMVKDDPAQPMVAVEIPVQEGDQYTFVAVNWSGASTVPSAELANMIALKVGTPADTTELARDIDKAKDMFGAKGYMNAQVKTLANLDNEKHTAVFNLVVTEGPLYHMGKLEVQGPDPQRAELAKKVWEMREGDVYDASYIKTFMTRHPRELAGLNGWAPHYTQTIHDDTHVVDLSVKFEKFQPEAK